MPLLLILLIVLICAMPVVGIGMVVFCKKTTWKISGTVLFIAGIILFIHKAIGRTIIAYFNF